MSKSLTPEPGHWYKKEDDGDSFEVLFVDQDDGDIEIQYFDGAVEMIALEAWYKLSLVQRPCPGTLDDAKRGHPPSREFLPSRWSGPLDWTGPDE